MTSSGKVAHTMYLLHFFDMAIFGQSHFLVSKIKDLGWEAPPGGGTVLARVLRLMSTLIHFFHLAP